jgi:hypothetical protein
MRRELASLAAGLLLCGGAAAQQQPNPHVFVTGVAPPSGSGGDDETIKFVCRGIPTCTGAFTSRVRSEGCPNYVDYTGTVVISGLSLAQSGPQQGTAVVTHPLIAHPPGAACQVSSQTKTNNLTYTGTWNRDTGKGTLRVTSPEDPNDVQFFNFTADLTAPPPIFQMLVNSRIDAASATVSADLQFRSEDVGRNGSVFVFASAPATRVRNGLEAKAVRLGSAAVGPKADPQPCVLAQLTGGQLEAVTTTQLAAFSTGVFSSAGSAVTILNNTPTSSVAGATFYVGYGTSAQSMIDNGVFKGAALVPGDAVCPMLPYTTALWLHPSEAGWGLNVTQQGSIAFATLFTYDAARQPLWLLMSGGQLQPDGLTFSGDLYRTTGPAFNSNPFTPIGSANYRRVGTMTMTVTEANAAQLTYSVDGVTVEKSIQRYVFGSHAAVCLPTPDSRATSTNYTDLWWDADESGWGLNITHQDNTLFGTLFTYAAGSGSSNAGLWLVMSGGVRQSDGSYLGDLYRTTGPAFNAVPFTPITLADMTVVGTMRLRFSDGSNGTLNYSVDGVAMEKAITRIPFSTPVAACN